MTPEAVLKTLDSEGSQPLHWDWLCFPHMGVPL